MPHHSPLQEAAAAAAARDTSRPPGLLHWPANKLLDLFESPAMAAYEGQLQPVVAALQRRPLWGWLVPLLIQLIVLRQINRLLVGRMVSIAAAVDGRYAGLRLVLITNMLCFGPATHALCCEML
jgi:hypothetical protein